MCDKLRVALFGAGQGSSIQYVIDYLALNSAANFTITDVVVTENIGNFNSLNDGANKHRYNMRVLNSQTFSSSNRAVFEKPCYNFWNNTPIPHVVFLLGWNYIMSTKLLQHYSDNDILVINLHPALPDSYIGNNVVSTQFNDIRSCTRNVERVGSQVHVVTPVLDRGYVLDTSNLVINRESITNEDELMRLMKINEKPMILNVLFNLVNEYKRDKLISLLLHSKEKYAPFYRGKVRSVADIGYNLLLMTASNRVSAFDRHLTTVPDKGNMLNEMSAWWFKKTSHIIPNHYLFSSGEHMVVQKCKPIMLEVVVRAYMTGSSSTSIWTKYKNGERNMYGLSFRDGYRKNQKLDNVIVTPTTKGEVDIPITRDEIIQQGILSTNETDYVFNKALELFEFGSLVAAQRGLLLVDTKYEFGYLNGEIILMDEIHTCDSSRYWKLSSYQTLFEQGNEPEKYDKDCIRDYVKANYSNEEIANNSSFDIPDDIVSRVNSVYREYYRLLTKFDTSVSLHTPISHNSRAEFVDTYLSTYHREIVVILAGSTSDREHVEKIKKNLNDYNIYSKEYYKSAHKNTLDVMNILTKYDKQVYPNHSRKIVFVTVAGRSNALSGVVASNVKYPVIACPPFKDKMDMFTNINSSLQCPSKVPVLTVLEPQNVAISIRYMFDNN